MKTAEMRIQVLEALQGEFLTRMNLEEGAECIFVTNVFLVQGASESDWRAATILEREAWERQNMELGQETA